MNLVVIHGKLADEPQVFAFVEFDVIVTRPGKNKGSDLIRCRVYEGSNTRRAQRLVKDEVVTIAGRLRTRPALVVVHDLYAEAS